MGDLPIFHFVEEQVSYQGKNIYLDWHNLPTFYLISIFTYLLTLNYFH